MSSYPLMSDSDSDSLPDLSELFPEPSKEIVKGDIVWAKFRKLFWPALVRHVYKKEKKVTVWYTDEPGKSFKLHMKDIYLFHDQGMTTKIKKEANDAGVRWEHEGLTSHAFSYLNRKSQGFNDDPLKFFDQTFPFFIVEEWLKKNPNADRESLLELKIEPLYTKNPNKILIGKSGSLTEPNASNFPDKDSDIEFTVDEDSEEESSLHDNKVSNLGTSVNSGACSDEYDNKIVTCITSGKADMHLINIRCNKAPSKYQEFYLRAMKNDKRDLDYISYGPLDDVKKLTEIIFYLTDLYFRVPFKTSKKGNANVAQFFTNKTEEARYIASVWLPESIVFAISNINNISLFQAKTLFHEKISKSKEVQKLLEIVIKDIDNSADTQISGSHKKLRSSVGISSSNKHEHCGTDIMPSSAKRPRRSIRNENYNAPTSSTVCSFEATNTSSKRIVKKTSKTSVL